jgi:flagellar protein FliS
MTASSARAMFGYRAAQTQTASPLELVVLLYDGALRFLADAERAMATHDLRSRATSISRAMAIVIELQATLDMTRGGAVAAELDRLYDFVQERLLATTRDNDATALADAQRVLAQLADAWRTVASGAHTGAPTEVVR